MSYFCTAPVLDCDDPSTLNTYFNASASGRLGCEIEMKMRTGARIYLAAGIFNAVFVILTTALFIHCASSGPSHQAGAASTKESNHSRKSRKRNSIRKRSVLATTLGACGHLIFSTGIFFTQAFNRPVGCQLALWSVILGFYTWMAALIIRAYRLRFLFRLNQLKVKYLRMTAAERSTCINEKEYCWYLIHARNKDDTLRRPYLIYGMGLLLIIIITIPAEITMMRQHGKCLVRWGMGTLVGFCGLFLVLAPFLFFYLKDNVDAHGIRTEIFVDAVIAVPFFSLYFAWFFLSAGDSRHLSFYVHKAFGPGNWVVFFTIASHIISVVVPLIQYYTCPVENNNNNNNNNTTSHGWWTALCRRRHHHHHQQHMKPDTTTTTTTAPRFLPELSIESLERSLADPDIMRQLQDLAIADFSSENLLFYDSYLTLEEKFKKEIIIKMMSVDEHYYPSTSYMMASPKKKWITSIAKKSPNTIPLKSSSNDKQDESHYRDDEWSLEKFLSLPIPSTLYGDFIQLYELYIQHGAPHQINISYRARRGIDHVFEYMYATYPELRRSDQVVVVSDSCYYPLEKTQLFDDSPPPILNFGLFELARKEVCWNIFNSVYPKVVNLYI